MKAIAFLAALPFMAFAADFEQGFIRKEGPQFYIENSKEKLLIEADEKISRSLPSLESPSFVVQSNNRPYAFEFKGQRNGNSFQLGQVPTNTPGPVEVRGVLEFDTSTGSYSISGRNAIFGYTKTLSGYEFDEISKQYFVGKDVIAEGELNDKGEFVMQALTPADIFSATPASFQKGGKDFILKEMVKNENSQSRYPEAFKRSVFTKSEIQPGDTALIVTHSGRQGDSFGSVNGHFVAGLAEVRNDLTLRGEVSNAYVTNGKDILSGNTSLTNYFSHLVQGQNVYRPTYTLVLYGVAKEKLQLFRNALEASHIEFRTKKLDITPQFNCTTETIKALADAGIKSKYSQADNTLAGLGTKPLVLFGETAETIQFALANDPSRYHPRAAFNSFVKAAFDKNFQKKHGIKRVDYIFYPQIPSRRPVGGIALESIWKVNKYKKLYEKYEVNPETSLPPEELRGMLELLNEIE